MGSIFSPKMPSPPPPPPPPPAAPSFEDEQRKAEAKAKQDALERKRRGRKSTILTSASGLTEDQSVLEKKTLLGA
jgi:hypothetical protein